MTEIQLFQFQGQDVRVIDGEMNQWFVLRDVLQGMNRQGTRTNEARESIEKGLGEGYVRTVPLETPGGIQDTTIINEAAVTFLVSRSNTEQGRKLNRWIHTVVIPSIRRTGGYQVQKFNVPKTMSEALRLAADQAEQIECQRAQLEAAKPAVEFYQAVADTSDTLSISEMAKLIGTGQKRLFQFLRDSKVLMPNNAPYQQFIDAGYFRVTESSWEQNGQTHVRPVSRVTGKGQDWVRKQWERVYRPLKALPEEQAV